MNSSTPPELLRIVVRSGLLAVGTMQPPCAEKRGDSAHQADAASDRGDVRHATVVSVWRLADAAKATRQARRNSRSVVPSAFLRRPVSM